MSRNSKSDSALYRETSYDDLRADAARLIEDTERLALYFNHSGVGLWDARFIDGDPAHPDTVTRFSPEFWRIMGYDEVPTKENPYLFWAKSLHPHDRERATKAYERHLADETGQTPFNETYRLLKKDASWGWYHATGGTLRDSAGKPIRAAGTMVDISSVKESEAAAHLAKEEAHRADRTKTAFMSAMSHELRTPLNAILGFSEMMVMMRGNDLEAPCKDTLARVFDYSSIIRESADKMRALVDNVYLAVQLHSGDLVADVSNIDVVALVREEIKKALHRCVKEDDAVEFITDAETITWRVDPILLRRAFANLLTNALEFAGDAGPVVVQFAKGGETGDRFGALLTIEDRGPGMDAAQIKASRENKFAHYDPNIAHGGGAGMGLPVTHQILSLMQMELFLEPGGGGQGLKATIDPLAD